MTDSEILSAAPEGATHYDKNNYVKSEKYIFSDWDAIGCLWCAYYEPSQLIRSLGDIKRNAEQQEHIKELEQTNAGLHDSIKQINKESVKQVKSYADEIDALEYEVASYEQRVKELEQERGRFHQFRAESAMVREMLLNKDVNADDVAPIDLKNALLKRDLEQQMEGAINFVGWYGVVTEASWREYLAYHKAQLKQQAEELK